MIWKTKGGRCIHHAANGANVYQNLLYRWLTFESKAIQTIINRRHPERCELRYINHLAISVRTQPADCCLLGLGGAAVAHLLAPHLGQSKLFAVERDIEVIDIARTYFMTDRLKNLNVVHEEANQFLQQCKTHYQHLLVDLFDANSFPAECNTPNFFEHCRRILLPDGILAINLANLHEQWSIFKLIRAIFQQRTVSLPVKGTANMVVLACNSQSVTSLLDVINENQQLKKLSWDAKWGCVAEL